MKTIGIAVAGLSLVASVSGAHKSSSYYNECPHGYENNGEDSCTKTVSKPASRRCPDGFSQSGGHSFHTHSLFHHHMSSSSSITCSQTLSEDAQVICPGGYELSHGSCVMTSEAPREYFCPAGYEDDKSKECSKTEFAEFLRFCAEGKMANDGCVTYNSQAPQSVCPGGFKLSGSSCVAYEEAPYQYYCPNDYVKSETKGSMGDCSKILSEEVIYSCPSGTVREGEDCASYETTHPEKICPAELEGHDCFETTYVDKEAVCPAEYSMSTHTGADGGLLCEKCANVHKQTSRCEYKPATLICPPGFYKPGADKTQGCIQKTPVPFNYICPDGYTEKSDKGSELTCIKRESHVLSASCKSGFTKDESKTCTKIVSVPQKKKCPEGFESSASKGECKKVLSAAPEIVCPDHFELKGHSCVQKIVQAISTKCPYSFEASGDQCVKLSTVPKLSQCPEYYSDSYGKSECKRIESTEPETVCPEGYELDYGHLRHSTCTTTITAPFEYFCTKGYTSVGEECISTHTIAPIQKHKKEWHPVKKSKGY